MNSQIAYTSKWSSRIRSMLPEGTLVALLVLCFAEDGRGDQYSAPSGVPRLLAYRGTLRQNGQPVSSATPVPMRVWLYSAATNGTVLWGPEVHSTQVTGGAFALQLGDNVPLDDRVLSGGDLYVAVEVQGTLLSGRQRLLGTPYALRSSTAATLEHLRVLSTDLSLLVKTAPNPGNPNEFGSLPAALASLDSTWIPPSRAVTIRIDAGTFRHTGPITVNHSQSDRIFIVGAGPTTILEFDSTPPNTPGGFSVVGPHLLNLDALTLRRTGTNQNDSVGVAADANAVVSLGPAVTIDQFHIGVYASLGAAVKADYVTVTGAAYAFSSDSAAAVSANHAQIRGSSVGMDVLRNGFLSGDNATIASPTYAGFQVYTGGVVSANDAVVTGGTNYSYLSTTGGFMQVDRASANSGPFCYYANYGGWISATAATAAGCAAPQFTPATGSDPRWVTH